MTKTGANSELISVIIPAHNAARHISATLRSVRDQTYRSLEIIAVDDGSTDNTGQILEKFAAEDRRTSVLRQNNSGVAMARNLAISHARGDFIAPLDADDIWHPEKLTRQFSALSRGGATVGLVYTWSRIIDDYDRLLSEKACKAVHSGSVLPFLLRNNFIGSASSPLIRRECLVEAGGYDPSLRAAGAEGCEDYQLYIAIAEHYHFEVVPAFLVEYRVRPNSMSQAAWQMMLSHDIVMGRARKRHPELPDDLFRQSSALMAGWLAKRCFRSGRITEGIKLLARAACLDPALVCRHGSSMLFNRSAGERE
jgi:glycosyltransferase involved in cell wall biosynthesis